jgi:broad specificity phosphatase PhoE
MASKTTATTASATASASTTATNSATPKSIKTIYLIRHAESEENRRIGSLKSSLKGLTSCLIPNKNDIYASMELLNVKAQIDSDVSPKGQAQIDQLGKRLIKDEFVIKTGIQLVAHSPLKRARQTSHGMLQTVTVSTANTSTSTNKNTDNDTNNDIDLDAAIQHDSSAKGAKHPSIQRVIQLDILSERTPLEWLPTHYAAYANRITEFEIWLREQKEDVIAIVGHSQYFRSMLGLKSKFNNVDVWSLQFDPNDDGNDDDSDKNDEGGNGKNGKEEKDMNMNMKIDETEDKNRGIVTEIDGVLLDDLKLPRRWKQLRHHYRFDPNYTE